MKTDATGAHIDAETMAAWAERGLPADVAAAVELHLSQCDRCQEVLAAFVRSEPVPAVVIPFWSRRPVQWSAAGLAAAAALIAMIYIGRPPIVPAPESTIASAPTPTALPVPPQLEPSRPAPAAAEPAPTAEKANARQTNSAMTQQQWAKATPAAPPSPPPAPQASMPPPSSPVTAAAAPPPAVMPVGAGAGAGIAMDSFSEVVVKTASGALEVVAPSPALASRAAAGAGGRGGGARVNATEAMVPTRWRVLGGTRLERSSDAGATWVALTMEPMLTQRLAAGAATSQSVCWFVGADGVVLLTTDGQTLRRVSLPESVPLTGVVALDGARATVTAADGRKFTTADGGLTWKAGGALQDF